MDEFAEARRKQIRLRFGSEYVKVCENVVDHNNTVYEILCLADWTKKNELDKWVYICIESDDAESVGKTYCNAEPCYPKEPVNRVEYEDYEFVPFDIQPTHYKASWGDVAGGIGCGVGKYGIVKKVNKRKWVKVY